ncbi:type IV pilus modification PilV family protein [Selenihalanaerobacter shriftii]|uniref:Prepilin-type N-terminal cleavage/methylation domain-containing protein n=1 Tax=Selenihalanaerobacter shriftii TaxID=142842 RepID=A0A1T4P4N3_9FIRM|nr:hypothetical protein [Selenihalanaerobacter shriftii]SJZ86216.1 hypothetical protein SAMN02745118_02042 [Selenihalanaerobacter shriftii]
MFQKESLQQEEGMSLIEVVVGITLLTIALIPMMNFFANNTRMTHNLGMREKALNLAQATIEGLKAQDFDSLSDSTDDYGNITIDVDGDGNSDYLNFRRVIKIEPYPADPGDLAIRLVTVEVFWDNDNQHVELQTLIARR